jgi:hypothetical protein
LDGKIKELAKFNQIKLDATYKYCIMFFWNEWLGFSCTFSVVDPHFKFYGVLERTKNLAEEKYPGVKTFRTLEDMLADKKC